MSAVPAPGAQPDDHAERPAPFSRRAAARAVDTFASLTILLAGYVVGGRLALATVDGGEGELGPEGQARLLTSIAVAVVLVVAYEVVPTAYAGATLGKRVVGTRVVRADRSGRRVGLPRALARWLPPSLGGLVCGLGVVVYFSALLDNRPERQGWHDMLARTVVVVPPPKVRQPQGKARTKGPGVSRRRPTR